MYVDRSTERKERKNGGSAIDVSTRAKGNIKTSAVNYNERHRRRLFTVPKAPKFHHANPRHEHSPTGATTLIREKTKKPKKTKNEAKTKYYVRVRQEFCSSLKTRSLHRQKQTETAKVDPEPSLPITPNPVPFPQHVPASHPRQVIL